MSFDYNFYINHYSDLKKQNWNIEQAYRHWLTYGKREGRICNPLQLYPQYQNTIALIIPGTSNKRKWNKIIESDLFNILLKTFIPIADRRYKFKIFFGIDRGDTIYDNPGNQSYIKEYIKGKNVEIEFMYMDIEKGHLSLMWNKLYREAYDQGYEYFYQCGDDITFTYKNMFHECVSVLKSRNDIGLTGPYTTNGNTKILTQSFVSRKHMDIFGFYFPPEIKNWYVDDWITNVYQPSYFYPLRNFKVTNSGGPERYKTETTVKWIKYLNKYKPLLDKYLQTS